MNYGHPRLAMRAEGQSTFWFECNYCLGRAIALSLRIHLCKDAAEQLSAPSTHALEHDKQDVKGPYGHWMKRKVQSLIKALGSSRDNPE